MQYLLLIYDSEKEYQELADEERNGLHGEYFSFTGSIRESGNFVGGAQLQPTGTATSIRVRNGDTLVTDGPFAETKEQLGGFYLIEATDVDEAIALAARIPSARLGTIEVRPLVPMESEAPA
jgi:hypothetical protein